MRDRRVSPAIGEHAILKCARLRAQNAALAQWLAVVLDAVDYTAGACSPTEMIGACLDESIIKQAKAALAMSRKEIEEEL